MSEWKQTTSMAQEAHRQVKLAVAWKRLELRLEDASKFAGREHLLPISRRIASEVLEPLCQVMWLGPLKKRLGDLDQVVRDDLHAAMKQSVDKLLNGIQRPDDSKWPKEHILWFENWRKEATAWLAWFGIQRDLREAKGGLSGQLAVCSRECGEAQRALDSLVVLSEENSRTVGQIRDCLQKTGHLLGSLEPRTTIPQVPAGPTSKSTFRWTDRFLSRFLRDQEQGTHPSPVVKDLLDCSEIEELTKTLPDTCGPIAMARFARSLDEYPRRQVPRILEDLAILKSVDYVKITAPPTTEGIVRMLVLNSIERRLREWAAQGEGDSHLWGHFEQFQAEFGRPSGLKVLLSSESEDEQDLWLKPDRLNESRRRRLHSPIVLKSRNKSETALIRGMLTDHLPIRSLVLPLEAMLGCAEDGGGLADGCCRILESMRQIETVEDWWEYVCATDGKREEMCLLIWRTFAWAVAWSGQDPQRSNLVNDLLLAFEQVGFRIEGISAKAPGKADTAVHRVHRALLPSAGTKHASKLLATGDGGMAALRTPDGRQFQPVLWLRVPACWDDHPVLQMLFDMEPLLLMLRQTHPDWTGWMLYDDVLESMLFQTDVAGPSEAGYPAETVLALFTGLVNWQDAPPEAKQLATAIYRVMGPEQRARLPLPFYLDTLDIDVPQVLASLAERDLEDLEIRWKSCEKPHGTMLGSQFRPTGRSLLELSLGPDFPLDAEVIPWLALPAPPLPAKLEGTGAENPLLEGHRQLARVGLEAADAESRFQRFMVTLEMRIRAVEAREWFDAFMRDVTALKEPLVTWYDLLKVQPWWTCYPAYDDRKGVVCWPSKIMVEERLSAPEGLGWKFDDTTPRGCLCPEPYFFAAISSMAKGTFSRGKRDAPEVAGEVAVCDLLESLESLPPDAATELRLLCRRWLFSLDERVSAHQDGIPAESCIEPILDQLVALANDGLATADELDGLLTKLRKATEVVFGLVIEPEAWTYRNGMTGADITPPPTAEQIVFHPSVQAKGVILRRFGIRDGNPPEVAVSAGPAPPNFHQLQQSLEQRESRWASHLAQWPKAAHDGTLKSKAERFFEDAWEELETHERTALKSLLSAQFHLETFEPKSISDRPRSWFELSSNAQTQSGAVTRIYRPGLRDEADQLRVRAKVDVQ